MTNDTDRIIAAQAAQAHKTRVLLAWIFIGIPMISGLVWLLLVVVASGSSGSGDDDSAALNVVDTTVDAPTYENDATDDLAEETPAPPVPLATMRTYIGKRWSDVPQDVQDQTIQVDPWGNVLANVDASQQAKWTVSDINNNSTNLTFVMKPIGDAHADGDTFVHSITYSVTGTARHADITYSTNAGAQAGEADHSRLPWSKTITVGVAEPAVSVVTLESGTVRCSMTVDGKLADIETADPTVPGVVLCDFTGDDQ